MDKNKRKFYDSGENCPPRIENGLWTWKVPLIPLFAIMYAYLWVRGEL